MEPSESGRTVRVMIRKEFKLQPDGSYREMSMDQKNVELSPEVSDMETVEEAESAPPVSYAYSPYPYYSRDSESYGDSSPYLQFTADDVQDVMRQLEQSQSYNVQPQSQPSSYSFTSLRPNKTVVRSAPAKPKAQVRSAGSGYTQYEIKKAPSQAYFLDDGNNIRSASGYNSVPQSSSNSYGAPNSIQEILKNKPTQQAVPAATNNNHYYSPKDQYSYNYDNGAGGYAFEGPSTEYGGPTTPFVPVSPTPGSEYGVPNHMSHNQWSSSYSDVKHGGGGGGLGAGVGGVVNSLVHSVQGVHKAKAAQVSSVLHQKGELGSQILNQGGKVVQQAVHQKAEKAKIIGETLSQVPVRFSQVLRNKAEIATGLLDHGSRAFGSVLNVKAQVANQASNLIAAKGKAANAVIKASGGTAADLIVAKGKGIAHLINSGGRAASALLNHKGNKVTKIAEVLGGVAGSVHGVGIGGGGYGGGWESHSEGISGGYSENQAQYEASPSRVYDELQDALKTVVQSPASSYGEPPASASSSQEGNAKLTSAFRSIYDNFKSGQPQVPINGQSLFGSYSSTVQVTAKPEKEQITIGQSATAIGESLNKMSKMLTNVANAIDWLSPNKNKES